MNNQQNIDAFFTQFAQKVQNVQQRLANIIGTEVVNASLDNFRTESFEGQKWPARKDKKNRRKLLVKTGALQRSVRIVSSSLTRITVGSDLPYAEIHNNGGIINRAARTEMFIRNRHQRGRLGKLFGGKGAFRRDTKPGKGTTYKSYTINMPQRRFLGSSPRLKNHLQGIIKEEFLNEFKNR